MWNNLKLIELLERTISENETKIITKIFIRSFTF